jgi:integrase
MFFALTGARHGEGLGLQWPDVDFDQQTVAIRRSWSGRYRNSKPIFHTPKTKGSRRVVPIPDELVHELKKWQLRCPTSKWDLVFPKLNGRPQYRKDTWRALDRAVRNANAKTTDQSKKLPRRTIHSLRHSFASTYLMNGTPIPEVSAMLGHSNVSITLAIYSYFVPKTRTDSANKLASVIFKQTQRR